MGGQYWQKKEKPIPLREEYNEEIKKELGPEKADQIIKLHSIMLALGHAVADHGMFQPQTMKKQFIKNLEEDPYVDVTTEKKKKLHAVHVKLSPDQKKQLHINKTPKRAVYPGPPPPPPYPGPIPPPPPHHHGCILNLDQCRGGGIITKGKGNKDTRGIYTKGKGNKDTT